MNAVCLTFDSPIIVLQSIQVLWDIRTREVAWPEIVESILSSLDTEWRPKEPTKERDTRWRSNGIAALNILKGWYIQDENGTPFWVLLGQRLTYIYNESDWRIERIEAFIEMMLMPEVIFGLWMEAESVQFFDMHYKFHAMCGALANRPGFRALELYRAVCDHFFPWWEAALQNPELRYPNTFKFIKEYMEDKGLHEMAKEKKEQLMHGIQCAHDEMAKLCKSLCTAPWIFTWLTCPTRGAIILRVILQVLREEQFNVDAVVDDEGDLIDRGLEWGDLQGPEVRCDTHLRFYALLKPDGENLVHYFQELGFLKSRCRNDLMKLSQERGLVRDPDSKTYLFDFARAYSQLFDMLHSNFARFPSASRIGEGFHAIERNAFDEQTSDDMADARGRYLIKNEHDNRSQRRHAIYERAGDDVKLTRAPKHNDRVYTVKMAGEQLIQNSAPYTKNALTGRFSEDELTNWSITAINKEGTKARQREREKKVAAHAEAQRKKKLGSDKYTPKTLEEYQQRAEVRSTEYDKRWRVQFTPDAVELNQLKLLLTRAFWDKIKVSDGFWEELKKVLPLYWKLINKEAKGKGKKLTKTSVMNGKAPVETGIAKFLDDVSKIADGATNTLSTKTRARELKRADASSITLMKEFVKHKHSASLKRKEKENAEKHKTMRGVIKDCGTDLKEEWQTDEINIERHTISYRHPPMIDEEDLMDEGSDDLADFNEEEDRAELSDSEMDDDNGGEDESESESDTESE